MKPDVAIGPESFSSFGAMLKYFRRRARLTQRDLALAVGYSVAHLCRLEQNQRLPDLTTLLALFVPALELDEPVWIAQFLELAAAARGERLQGRTVQAVTSSQQQQTTILGASDSLLPPLPAYYVARPNLLADLQQSLQQQRALVIYGLAGSGKTTLVTALAYAIKSVQPVFWLTFTAGITTSVDALLRQLAVFLFAHECLQVQPLLEQTLPRLPLDQQMAIISSALSIQPVLLCLDNGHLVQHNEALLNLLRHLVAVTPVSLIVLSREHMPLPEFTQIYIADLSRDEGRALIRALEPTLPMLLVERLLTKTAAHPMFVRLALGHLGAWDGAAEDFIEQLEMQPHVNVYVMDTALQGLGSAAYAAVTLLAVFRQPVNLYDPSLIDQCHRYGVAYNTLAALVELQQRCLIDHPARAALHPLLHDHVQTTINTNPPLRQRLHAVAAAYSEHTRDYLAAAYHWCRADNWAQALDAMIGESETVADRGLSEIAVDVIDDILGLVRRGVPENSSAIARLLIERATCLTHTIRAPEAENNYRAALAYPLDSTLRAYVLWRLAENLIQRGKVADALALTEEASALLPQSNVMLHGYLGIIKTAAMLRMARYAEAHEFGAYSLTLADQLEPLLHREAARIRGQTHNLLGIVQHIQRNVEQALIHWQTAVAIARQSGMRQLEYRCLSNIAAAFHEAGELEQAIMTNKDALQRAQLLGDSYSCGRLLFNLSLVHYVRNEIDEAVTTLEQARVLKQRMGDDEGVATVDHQRALLELLQGNIAASQQLVEAVLAQSTINERLRAFCRSTRAALYSVQGAYMQARLILEEELTQPSLYEDKRMYGEVLNRYVIVLLAAGATSKARQWLGNADVTPNYGLEVDFERRLVYALLSMAEGDVLAARHQATTIADQAQAAGYVMHRRMAGRLVTATLAPPPANRYPSMMWIDLD